MTVLITLTLAGAEVGPFDIYTQLDGFTNPVITGVSRAALLAGYNATLPNGTTDILVQSTGECTTQLYLTVDGGTTTTTTTTSSTTTLYPPINLAENAEYANAETGCSTGSQLDIYLDASDYALFIANGNIFGGIGGGSVDTCTAIARSSTGNVITAYVYDNVGVCWKLTAGNFTYANNQCV